MMWKDKYKIGVDLIDNQHKELFARLSNFIDVVQNEVPWEEKNNRAKETLLFMNEYVDIHFADEERYQEAIGYRELDEHRQVHENFKAGVRDYVENFDKEGFTEEKIQEFAGRLMAWLIMHVGYEDQKIGKFVEEMEEEI